MPLDIKLFRADHPGGNPDAIRESQRRRFQSPDIVDEKLNKAAFAEYMWTYNDFSASSKKMVPRLGNRLIGSGYARICLRKSLMFKDKVIKLDTQWRDCRSMIDSLNKDRNRFQKEVTKAKKAGGEDPENAAKILEVAKKVKVEEAKLAELGEKVSKLLPKIGNIVAKDVPTSEDEDKDNEVVSTFGPTPKGDHYMHHHEVLHRIGGYEPERGVGVAGHRAYFLRDAGLLLNQALINYGIAFLRKRKYTVLQPPYFMTKDVMAGVAQLEQFDEELYKVSGEGTDEKYLIATSEQPICAFHKGEWLQESELPLRYGGVSTCFRKEAGAHGKDTWGIFRVHQFEKVEQFCICEGDLEKSAAMQEEMRHIAEEFYKSLGISYRVVNIVSGELNNAAIKKYDLEAWFPAYEEFRELVSCSNCTDYQSRGMEVRSGQKKMGQQDKKYVHMLNSTLCATTRTISCILENYQTPTGVVVPEVLVPYLGGITFLDYVKELPKAKREAKGSTKGGYATKTDKKPAPKPSTPATVPAANGAGVATESRSRGLPVMGGEEGGGGDFVAEKIVAKGLEIRELKKSKPDKATLQPHIDILLALKAEYKTKTGKDYAPAPGVSPAALPPKASAPVQSPGGEASWESPVVAELYAKITAKGDEIRELKKSKPDKTTLQPHIDTLIALKTDYKKHAGKDYVASGAPSKQPKSEPKPSSAKTPSEDKGQKKTKQPKPATKGIEAKETKAVPSARPVPRTSISKGPVMENGKPNLENLAQHLLDFSYIAGWAPGRDDASMFELLAQSAEARAVPTVGRWLCHIASFSAGERKAWQ